MNRWTIAAWVLILAGIVVGVAIVVTAVSMFDVSYRSGAQADVAVSRGQSAASAGVASPGSLAPGSRLVLPSIDVDAGIVVVCSAGNYGRAGNFSVTSPGNSPKVITVGSLTDKGTGTYHGDDFVSTYSSRGPTLYDHYMKPDLVAPGNRVRSTMSYEAYLLSELSSRALSCGLTTCYGVYMELSGTSMAAPHVSALAALLVEEYGRNPARIKAAIQSTADDLGQPGTDPYYGKGRINVWNAVQ